MINKVQLTTIIYDALYGIKKFKDLRILCHVPDFYFDVRRVGQTTS